ncbi:MAG: metallophosphoesterase [Myxococcales bacterium]|nr:metallophosphoesterase [Myxococcales bacterium]
MALKLLHTADWHLGRRFPSFPEADEQKLTRARLDVLDKILRVAEQRAVDAVLCAGDLFDEPSPEREWWEPVAKKLAAWHARIPVFLLPGNHDPIQATSVYHPDHGFRRSLPAWVRVVDRDDFSCALNDAAVLYARPCRSAAGQDDPALALPAREPGDKRIRIGMVHGSTFDYVDCQTNFPISKDAAAQRGLDYLAIGDTHSFRVVPEGAQPPVVYPGAPEATTFGEPGAGNVVAVFVSRSRRVVLEPEPVAYWQWQERRATSLADLRDLRREQLARAVLRLTVVARLSATEYEEAEAILRELKGTSASHGRVGILVVDRTQLTLDTRGIERQLDNLPAVLRATVARLKELEEGEQAEYARAALYHLFRMVREERRP